ncbi:EamA family transporter [Luteibacter sp. CQ10]|uniref:EamA family transporter n=1 Tax=Luteibacter sp. CQ10 TaxID=2805821 RepID=UPI0034A2FB51
MKGLDLLLGILVTIIWGSNFSVIEVGLRDLDPFLLTGLRFALTALPLVFFLRKPRDVPFAALAAYGVIFGVGLWWVVNLAMAKGMSPGMSSLVLQFSAFFTVVASAVFLQERMTGAQVAGMLLAASGLGFVIAYTRGTATTVGIALVLVAACAWTVCNLIVKRYRPADMMAFVVWSSLFSAPVLLCLTFLDKGVEPFVHLFNDVSWAAIGSVVFQAYVTTVFGYMVWNNLMKTYPAAMVAPLSLIVPVSGIVTSYVAFDERFSAGVWVGVAVMLFGIGVFVCAPYLRRRVVVA